MSCPIGSEQNEVILQRPIAGDSRIAGDGIDGDHEPARADMLGLVSFKAGMGEPACDGDRLPEKGVVVEVDELEVHVIPLG